MPATSSEQIRHAPERETAVGPPGARPPRPQVRITNIYATPWHVPDGTAGSELSDYLRLRHLERYYRLSADQLPRVSWREAVDPGALSFGRWRRGECVTSARVWLFCLPSGQVVAAFSLDADCQLGQTIDLLEDCYLADVQVGEDMAEAYLSALATRLGLAGDRSEQLFLPERHQIVFDQAPAHDDRQDMIQRLIYRTDLPYRKEYSAIRYPPELNRRPGCMAAVGPYVSAVCGHPDFIENSIFISGVQAVAASAQLRTVRQAAYQNVRVFRGLEQLRRTIQDRRRGLETIADQLGDLELELSYSVEACADLGLLVPSLRVESFHKALYDSMDLAAKADTAGRMLQRLHRAIRSELTAIESIERRADYNRRLRYTVAVGFVSTIAVPASLVFAFLGINASQVNPGRSMFDRHYLAMYLTVGALLVAGALIFLAIYLRQRRNAETHQTRPERHPPALAPDDSPP